MDLLDSIVIPELSHVRQRVAEEPLTAQPDAYNPASHPDNPMSAHVDGASAFALPADELRALAHRAVDDFCDQLAGLADEPAWRPVPPEVRARLSAPAPRAGLGLGP